MRGGRRIDVEYPEALYVRIRLAYCAKRCRVRREYLVERAGRSNAR